MCKNKRLGLLEGIIQENTLQKIFFFTTYFKKYIISWKNVECNLAEPPKSLGWKYKSSFGWFAISSKNTPIIITLSCSKCKGKTWSSSAVIKRQCIVKWLMLNLLPVNNLDIKPVRGTKNDIDILSKFSFIYIYVHTNIPLYILKHTVEFTIK